MDEELLAIREKKLRDLMSEVESGKSMGDWPGEPIAVNDGNLDSAVKQYEVVVVDCWAPWCGPCRMIAPTIEQMSKDYRGKVVFGKLNTDESIGVATKFGIMSIPTLLFFKSGKLVDRLIGAVPREHIEERLKKIL